MLLTQESLISLNDNIFTSNVRKISIFSFRIPKFINQAMSTIFDSLYCSMGQSSQFRSYFFVTKTVESVDNHPYDMPLRNLSLRHNSWKESIAFLRLTKSATVIYFARKKNIRIRIMYCITPTSIHRLSKLCATLLRAVICFET